MKTTSFEMAFIIRDIFDGLSWQRMRFDGNSTLFSPDHFVISLNDFENKLWMMIDNLAFIHSLSNALLLDSAERGRRSDQLKVAIVDGNITLNELLKRTEA